jgi:hypothetical protein
LILIWGTFALEFLFPYLNGMDSATMILFCIGFLVRLSLLSDFWSVLLCFRISGPGLCFAFGFLVRFAFGFLVRVFSFERISNWVCQFHKVSLSRLSFLEDSRSVQCILVILIKMSYVTWDMGL